MIGTSRPARVSGARALGWALALVTLTGCDPAPGRACPAIGWSNQLVVRLADGWPPGEGRSVRVECSSPCGWEVRRDAPLAERTELTTTLDGTAVAIGLDMTAPDAVDVAVLGADGAALAGIRTDLAWVRVGGTAECGGPHEATVTVPAP